MTVPRSLAVAAGAALALTALLSAAPAASAATAGVASAAPSVLPASAVSSCTVTGGAMSWGVKESFRSYISGSIARGSWEVGEGAGYETPSFTFAGATGQLDPSTGAGSISFSGSVHFTGHGGILDLTIAAPTVRIGDDGTAVLLLDVRGTDTSGAAAIDVTQAEIGVLASPPTVDASTGSSGAAAVPLTLSATGAPAFGGFYEAGEELDPLSITAELSCATPEPTATATTTAPPVTAAPAGAAEADAPATPWGPIAVGAGVFAVGAVATGFVLRRRRG